MFRKIFVFLGLLLFFSYANGDPLNVIDADGRIGKGVVKGVVQGDFANYDNPAQQISGLVGQIATGFTPAGVLADIRDFGASVSDMATGDGSWKGLAIATAGLIPGVSEVRKGANVVEAVDDLRRVETATAKVYEDIATQATKNADSSSVVLGKYDSDLFGGNPYNVVAQKNGATFFELDNWDAVYKQYGDDVWNINQSFLDPTMESW